MSISPLTRTIASASYDGQDVGHESGLYASISNNDEFDAVVADIHLFVAGLDQKTSHSYDLLDNYEEECIENTPLYSMASDGEFKVAVQPEEHVESLRNIAYKADLYAPDHIMESLPKALDRTFKGEGFYNEAEEIYDGLFDFMNTYAKVLPVKDKMGLEKYSKEALRHRSSEKDEDDFIVEAANELDGNVVVATHDADYLDLGVDAAALKAIEHILQD